MIGKSFQDGLMFESEKHAIRFRGGQYLLTAHEGLKKRLYEMKAKGFCLRLIASIGLVVMLVPQFMLAYLIIALLCPKVMLALILYEAFMMQRTYRGEFPAWHGAEHKVIKLYQVYGSRWLVLERARQSSRISQSCGLEGLAALLVPSLVLPFTNLVVALAILAAYMAISWLAGDRLIPSRAMQERWATQEPSDEQLQVALNAMRALCQADEQGTESGQKFLNQLREPA